MLFLLGIIAICAVILVTLAFLILVEVEKVKKGVISILGTIRSKQP